MHGEAVMSVPSEVAREKRLLRMKALRSEIEKFHRDSAMRVIFTEIIDLMTEDCECRQHH